MKKNKKLNLKSSSGVKSKRKFKKVKHKTKIKKTKGKRKYRKTIRKKTNISSKFI